QNQECHFMKRKLLIILSIIILIIGGYFILNEYKKKRLVNEAQEKAEEYLKENYDDIESVQVTPDNYRFKHMSTLGIVVYINNNEYLYFYLTFLIDKKRVGERSTIAKASYFPPEKYEEKKDE